MIPSMPELGSAEPHGDHLGGQKESTPFPEQRGHLQEAWAPCLSGICAGKSPTDTPQVIREAETAA